MVYCCCFSTPRPEFRPVSAPGGRLDVVKGLPVVHVFGTPKERGAAFGKLTGENAALLRDTYLRPYIKESRWELAIGAAKKMVRHIPLRFRNELHGFALASGIPYNDVLLMNTFLDLRMAPKCSTTCAVGNASADGEIICGRNLDFPTYGIADKFTVLLVEHLDNGRAVALVTWPGLLGALSGINDRGLALFSHDTTDSGKTSLEGMPYTLAFRDILETCSTVDEAIAYLEKVSRTVRGNVVLVDRKTAAVVEFTADKIAVRRPENGFVHCTNHFRDSVFGEPPECWRYAKLEAAAGEAPHDIERVKKLLGEVVLEGLTMQSMVVRPAAMKLYLASGGVPATDLEYVELDLTQLFKVEPAAPDDGSSQ